MISLNRVPKASSVLQPPVPAEQLEYELSDSDSNVFQEVKSRLRELCLKRFEIIHLCLGLSNPQTAHYCQQFESLGFFFAGILPGTKVGDALILQYLNNVPIDYEKIKTKSQKGSELLAYIKNLDPNRI